MLEGFRKDFGKESIDELYEVDEIDFINNSSDFNFTSYNFPSVINEPPYKYGFENNDLNFDEFYMLIMGENIYKCIPSYIDEPNLTPIEVNRIITNASINGTISFNNIEPAENCIMENRLGTYSDNNCTTTQSILDIHNVINETQFDSYIGNFQNNQLPILKYIQFQKSNPYESIFRTLTRRIKVRYYYYYYL